MQWHSDHGLAAGWVTHSRYARKLRIVQEAYIREIGAYVADLMRRYPETVVAAAGDGEVELSFDGSAPTVLADYSPFAAAEFRDWLRATGPYAPGGQFAGQAYLHAARYAGDPSPLVDGNGDGRTLNGDFGTSFTSWALRYEDWSLNDPVDADPNRIPWSVYSSPGWAPADQGPGYFDAPRLLQPGEPWWEVWDDFRQAMVCATTGTSRAG